MTIPRELIGAPKLSVGGRLKNIHGVQRGERRLRHKESSTDLRPLQGVRTSEVGGRECS